MTLSISCGIAVNDSANSTPQNSSTNDSTEETDIVEEINPCDTGRRIFLTDSTFLASILGAPGATSMDRADHYCNNDTNTPGDGSYKALITDGANRIACTSANCSTGIEGTDWVLLTETTYCRTDGTTVIGTTNNNAVFDFDLENSLVDSVGQYFSGFNPDWTSSSSNCAGWTSTSGMAGNAGFGDLSLKDSQAISSGDFFCGSFGRLVCVEQ